jgi:hypothetical protein
MTRKNFQDNAWSFAESDLLCRVDDNPPPVVANVTGALHFSCVSGGTIIAVCGVYNHKMHGMTVSGESRPVSLQHDCGANK